MIFKPRRVEKLDTGNLFWGHFKSVCYIKNWDYIKIIYFHPVIYISVTTLVLAATVFIESVAPTVPLLYFMSLIIMPHVVFLPVIIFILSA